YDSVTDPDDDAARTPLGSVRAAWRLASDGSGLDRLLGRLLVLLDELERQLAAVVDLRDPHQDLLADRDDLLDVLDALAAVELAQLGDVQQAVLAREQRDE